MNKVTPKMISSLKPNEVFVFGSNLQGNHAGGAARFAQLKFGAEFGNPIGMQGQSYAIPTLTFARLSDGDFKLPIPQIGKYCRQFIKFAKSHPEMFFYVTPIGCGIAGFTEEEMAPLFKDAIGVDNIALPQEFLDVLGVTPDTDEEMPADDNVINEQKIRKIVRRCLMECKRKGMF